jgi:hypothetical protein
MEAFCANMADAHHLVKLVEGFTNRRARSMRAELRRKIGDALRIPEKRRGELDCLESTDVFLTFKPGARLGRVDFADARPLLRQALVAACAATECYIGDKVMQKVGLRLRSESSLTPRLRSLPLDLGDWMKIDRYERKGWGLKEYVVEPYVREQCSTAANKVGLMLSLLGVEDWAKKLDAHRKVSKGQTVEALDRITSRRNRIAHEADRVGRGRAALSVAEVKNDLALLESIVDAIDATV